MIFTGDSYTADIDFVNKEKQQIIFPNPVSDDVTIGNGQLAIGSEIKIVDALGKEVYSAISKTSTLRLQVSSLSSGIYFLKINSGESYQTTKLMKM